MKKILKALSATALAILAAVPLQATTYTINPTTLSSYSAVHPKLYMNSGTIATLKTNITSHPTGAPRWGEMWAIYKKKTDPITLQVPTAYTTPDTADEEIWQRPVGDNIAQLSLAYLLTKGTNPTVETFWLEAEDAVVSAPMAVMSDPAASGGMCIGTPLTGTSNNPNTQPANAIYYFTNRTTIAYHLWIRAYTQDTRGITAWINVDGVESKLNVTGSNGSWIWVNGGHYYLTPGNHVMKITYLGYGVSLDKMCMTTDYNLVPTGLATEQHWLDAQNFTLNANGVAPNANNLIVAATNGIVTTGDFQSMSGQWLEAWSGEANNVTTPVATATPDAQQTIGVNGGNYDVWARFKANEKGNDSFFFGIDNLGYSSVVLNGTSPYPYNTLVPAAQFAHLPKSGVALAAPYDAYPYREWVWKKVATNVALASGNHTLKICLQGGTMGINWNGLPLNNTAGCQIDRLLVTPNGTAAPADPNKYLYSGIKWAQTSCSYPTWGTGAYANDLSASHQLIGLSLMYDWLYSNLGTTDRTTIANRLSSRGAAMNTALPTAWYNRTLLQNHCCVAVSALTTAGLAIYGDTGMPDTTPWLNSSLGRINPMLDALSSDGAWHEGPGYWSYFTEHLLEYQDMANKMLGFDISVTPWLSQTATYRLYFELPQSGQYSSRTHVNFSDDYGFEWGGPNHIMRRLASRFNLPAAQWMAERYDIGNMNAGYPWSNFFWYNPSVPETTPARAGLPTTSYLTDLDFAILRSGWDGNESVVAYQSGPFMGHGVQAKNTTNPYVNWGGNHAHAAVGNFSIFGYNDWLILNDGYANNRKTNQSNTLLINNTGQLGEGTTEFNSSAAKVEDPGGVLNPAIDDALSYSIPSFDYVVGNATSCYASSTGLTKYRRHLLYVKPDVLVVVDDVALTASLPLELHFYPPNLAPTLLSANNYSTTTAKGAKINMSLLTPAQSTISTPNLAWSGGGGNHYCYKVTPTEGSSANWSNAVALAWSPSTTSPKTVTMVTDSDGGAWKFKVGTQTAILDRNAGHALDEKGWTVTALEAESVTLTAPMQTLSDATASGGSCITTPTGTTPNIPDVLASPSASYSFAVSAAGTYAIWARVQAANASSNSFWYAVNPAGSPAYTQKSTTTYGSWVWVNLISSASLAAGTNVVTLKYAAANCKFDQVIISPDPSYSPFGLY